MSRSPKATRIGDLNATLKLTGSLTAEEAASVVSTSAALALRDFRTLVNMRLAVWAPDNTPACPRVVALAEPAKPLTVPRAPEFDPRVGLYDREDERPVQRSPFAHLPGRQEAAAKILRMLREKTPKKLAAAGGYSYGEAEWLMSELRLSGVV